MTTGLTGDVRRELELRLESSIASYEKYKDGPPIMRSEVIGSMYRAAVLSHVLGRTSDGLAWFKRASEPDVFEYALLSLDFERVERICESRHDPQHAGVVPGLKWYLAKGDDDNVRRVLSEQVPAKKQAEYATWSDIALGIVNKDAERLSRGFDNRLKEHMRHCQRGREYFNGPYAFLDQHTSAFSALAVRRGLPVRINPKYLPAQVPFLFIMIHEPLESPPSRIPVDLVPQVYRSASR